MLLFVGTLWYLSTTKSVPPDQSWSLSEEGAIYIIHGAQDYDTGPGYYLYKTHQGKTSVARIDPESPAKLTHFTDRPVRLEGKVEIDATGIATVRIDKVERAD